MRWILLLSLAAAVPVTAPLAAAPAAAMADAPAFADAVEAAWRRSVGGQGAEARREEQAARRAAAGSWTPEPPSVKLAHQSDRLARNRGARELEVELEIPLWMPGTRAAATALADAEGHDLDARLRLARLDLAGEVRDAVWSLRLAESELEAALRRVADAQRFGEDVERRVAAGELARIDANQALGLLHQARSAEEEARVALLRMRQRYAALTGLDRAPDEIEPEPPSLPAPDADPRLETLQRQVWAARARLAQAGVERRDAPELTLAVTRERGDFEERYATTTTVGVRIPFGTDARNRPRITAAGAELAEAEATLRLERERIEAEHDAARAELDQARRVEHLASERARLAADTRQLLARAFDLGEIDLPARLRAESEAFDAELALSRARLQAGRARSRLNQAYGLLP